MKSSTLKSIENISKTSTFHFMISVLNISMIIGSILFIIYSINSSIPPFTLVMINLLCIIIICFIIFRFYIFRNELAYTMTIDHLGIYTFNNKNELITTILYESINSIELYDYGSDATDKDLRIEIKNKHGELNWKRFPQLYIIVTNKDELRLHFIEQACYFSKKISISQQAINYFKECVEK